MLAETLQQYVAVTRLSGPIVHAAESLEDTAANVAEWFELALAGRVVFLAMELVDAAFDWLDRVTEWLATFWDDSEQAGHFDPLDPRSAS